MGANPSIAALEPMINVSRFLRRSSPSCLGCAIVASRVVAIALAMGVAPLFGAAGEGARPNVLFIAVDDLRTSLGCYGDPVAITPHIDRLAARGTLYRRAYAQQAVCNPSRQSLLTGRRPDSLRIWDLKTVSRVTAPDAVTLPEHFKRSGYFTRSFGKIFHDGLPDPQSWSVPAEVEAVSKREDYRRPENRAPHTANKAAATEFVEAPDDAYPDGQTAAGAVAALERLSRESPERPFFLAVGIRKPHLPFTAPKRYWDLYDGVEIPEAVPVAAPRGAPEIALHNSQELRGYTDQPGAGEWTAEQAATLRRGYYAATTFADAQIGRVLDALERTGLAENTIVVLWGDHGFHLGEHGLWAKITNYEADTRVPLIVALPERGAKTTRTDAIVELVDVYPTLVELCGVPFPAGLEGRSFASTLGNARAPGRTAAVSQFPRPWMYRAQPEAMGYSVRTATHRYVEWRHFGTDDVIARELYAYDGDELFERVNLADEARHASLARELAALLPKSPASATSSHVEANR